MSAKPKTPQLTRPRAVLQMSQLKGQISVQARQQDATTTEEQQGEQDADARLKRQLGEGEPRAWALAWCEAGLVRPGRGYKT